MERSGRRPGSGRRYYLRAAACSLLLTLCRGGYPSLAGVDGPFVVGINEVRAVANDWIAHHTVFREAARTLPDGERFRIAEVAPMRFSPEDPMIAYRIDLAPRGYMVVSADRRLTPVRCFSATTDMVLDGAPGNALRAMLRNDLSAAGAVLTAADARADDSVTKPIFTTNLGRWDLLTARAAGCARTESDPTNILVFPLIETRWSQWRHYNARYPTDPVPGEGYDGRAPVGCVPVVGAQLARFYSWPPYGQGGHGYVDDNPANLISGAFSTDFRDAYDWANMLEVYDLFSDEPSNAVAAVSKLMYDLAVGVDMDFGSDRDGGSFAFLERLGVRLKRSFFYERGVSIARHDDPSAFDTAVRQDILAGQPVVAQIPGHAVIADGYAEEDGFEFLHVNYGWGGENDGWYQVPVDITGASLSDAITGLVPRPVPLLEKTLGGTNVSGRIEMAWRFPGCQLPRLTEYRILEGILHATNILDSADRLDAWAGDCPPWTVAADGFPGNCFRKGGEHGSYVLDLRQFVKPAAGAFLEFDYKTILTNDHFYIKSSIDGGCTWTVEKHFTCTGWDTAWHHASVDLSAYAGCETLIRFEYVFEDGLHWPSGGVWLDNIRIADVETPVWAVAHDGMAPDTNAAVTLDGRLDGCYYYSVAAFDGPERLAESPPLRVIVVLSPDLDVDGDGIPNGWEEQYFGSPTGAVAQTDADLDGVSNWAEYLAGTHPREKDCYFRLHAIEKDSDGLAVSWPSISNRIYSLWLSTNLTDNGAGFTPLTVAIPSDPPLNRCVDNKASGRPRGFYMIEILLAP